MAQWTGEPELKIEIVTNWCVGSTFIIKGFHHGGFENRGEVIQFVPCRIIQYNQLSSISRLPDTAENYSITTFLLTPSDCQIVLTVRVENFPTETI